MLNKIRYEKTKDFDNITAAIEWRKNMEKQLFKEVV